MKKNHYQKRDPIKDYFPLPNEIFYLDLSYGEIAVYLNKETKNIVDDIVKAIAQDERIAELYKEWNNINRQKLSVYHDKPDPDIPLEDNKEFRSIKNAIIKSVAEMDNIDQTQIANSRGTKMVTLWVKLLGELMNTSYQNKRAKLNNQIDSKLRNKIEQKKKALGIKTDHTVKEVKNDEQDFVF